MSSIVLISGFAVKPRHQGQIMVTITAAADVALDMFETGVSSALPQTVANVTPYRIDVGRGESYINILEGSDFLSTNGIVNSLTELLDGVLSFTIEKMSTPVSIILDWGEQQDYQSFFQGVMEGDDLVIGSEVDDRILSFNGNDTIRAGAGDDYIYAGGGHDIVYGGSGNDTLILSEHIGSFSLLKGGDTYILSSLKQSIKIDSIEFFYFENEDILSLSNLNSTIEAFDGLRYVASYTDLRQSIGLNSDAASLHYVSYGFDEGRNPGAFNSLSYIAAYSDLRDAFGINGDAATRHYINYGADEGRAARFDGMAYLASYSDLRIAFGNDAHAAIDHYILIGAKEGRTITFDASEYIASNPFLINVFKNNRNLAISHFVNIGSKEGLHADDFNALKYIASYSDLMTTFGVDKSAGLEHFLNSGAAEGRHVTFDPLAYAYTYSDVKEAFGDNELLLTQHYILYGFNEGRTINTDTSFF